MATELLGSGDSSCRATRLLASAGRRTVERGGTVGRCGFPARGGGASDSCCSTPCDGVVLLDTRRYGLSRGAADETVFGPGTPGEGAANTRDDTVEVVRACRRSSRRPIWRPTIPYTPCRLGKPRESEEKQAVRDFWSTWWGNRSADFPVGAGAPVTTRAAAPAAWRLRREAVEQERRTEPVRRRDESWATTNRWWKPSWCRPAKGFRRGCRRRWSESRRRRRMRVPCCRYSRTSRPRLRRCRTRSRRSNCATGTGR